MAVLTGGGIHLVAHDELKPADATPGIEEMAAKRALQSRCEESETESVRLMRAGMVRGDAVWSLPVCS